MSTQVSLSPTPGFCVKSATLQDDKHGLKGLKVFINIAWDDKVPAPPPATEDVIKRAMIGQDDEQLEEDGWYVPVVISEPRKDKDKAGKPSIVFDCVYNKTLKSRTLKEPEFKLFLIELALQRIEDQSGVILSRTIGTPNIAAKGKLAPRMVSIPKIADSGKKSEDHIGTGKSNPLIEEVSDYPHPPQRVWSWTWSKDGDRLQVRIFAPGVTRELIGNAVLDIEPRRLIFSVPTFPTLDVNLLLSDAELIVGHPQSDVLSLKRQRPFNVDDATSEWRVKEKRLVVSA